MTPRRNSTVVDSTAGAAAALATTGATAVATWTGMRLPRRRPDRRHAGCSRFRPWSAGSRGRCRAHDPTGHRCRCRQGRSPPHPRRDGSSALRGVPPRARARLARVVSAGHIGHPCAQRIPATSHPLFAPGGLAAGASTTVRNHASRTVTAGLRRWPGVELAAIEPPPGPSRRSRHRRLVMLGRPFVNDANGTARCRRVQTGTGPVLHMPGRISTVRLDGTVTTGAVLENNGGACRCS